MLRSILISSVAVLGLALSGMASAQEKYDLTNPDGELLMVQRAIEPRKGGWWTLPSYLSAQAP